MNHPYPCQYDTSIAASTPESDYCTCPPRTALEVLRASGLLPIHKARRGTITALEIIQCDDYPNSLGLHLSKDHRLSLLEQVRKDLEEENRKLKEELEAWKRYAN